MKELSENYAMYPEPPKTLRKLKLGNILRMIGPGAIIASVTVGSGELVWASRSGALFGTALLWVFLLAGILKGVQVYSSTRYITLTGEHPMAAWNRIGILKWWFPGLFIALPTFFAMPLAFSGISETLGYYALRLLEVKTNTNALGAWGQQEFLGNMAASILLIACFILGITTNLKVLERISIFVMATLVLCLIAAIIALRPDVFQVVKGLVPLGIPDFDPWVVAKYGDTVVSRSKWSELALYLTAVGGGTYDYLGYVGLIREKKWGLAGRGTTTKNELESVFSNRPTELKRAKIWTKAPLLDTVSSFALVIVVTLLFVILGSLVLHPVQEVPSGNDLLDRQENFLALLHPKMTWVYRIGVFLAFTGTLYGAFEIYRHSITETVRAFKGKMSSRDTKLWRRMTSMYCLFGALVLIWLPETISGNIVDRMVLSAVVGGAFTCGLWCFGMLLIDKIHLPKDIRMGHGLRFMVFIAGMVLSLLGGFSLIDYFVN